jgi:hypothetical protein
MEIYKIGKSLYEGTVDKNSGMYEYNLIKTELEGHRMDLDKTLIIIGGIPNQRDVCNLELLFGVCKGFKKIFIATDFSVFKPCADIIDKCDLVLHQSIVNLDFIPVKQAYGYMPELFFKEDKKPSYQMNMAIFGGNNLHREDKFEKYILNKDKKQFNEKIFSLYKFYPDVATDQELEDVRLDYPSYIQLSKLFRFNLMIVRKEYRDIGWATSRYVEAISNYNLPLSDYEYDKFNHFNHMVRTYSYKDVLYYVNVIEENERINFIEEQRKIIKENRPKFKELILNV